MKIWRCMVCGYEHEDEAPPKVCPICGVGPEEFMIKNNGENRNSPSIKRWKCTVCDYIHTGNEPPESCPLCGVGKELFVLLEEKYAELDLPILADNELSTIRAALNKISYGLYIITSMKENKYNGMCANTVFQLTDNPPRIAVCVNKNNLTHDYIEYSGVIAISILGREHMPAIKHFGHRSGRKFDKFAEGEYLPAANGCPILRDCIAYLEAQIIPEKTTDVGTHTLFVANVTSGRTVQNEEELTYAYYRQNR